MSPQQFLVNVAIIVAAMAVFAAIEAIVPLFTSDPRRKRRAAANFGLSVVTLALNWGLISAAAVVALWAQVEGQGVLARIALPGWAMLALTIVVLDFSTWVAHVAMHKIPALWAVHRVHHSDTFLDVGTTLRQHPLEGLWRFLWIIGPVWILGLPAAGVVLYRLTSVLQAIAEHANFRLPRSFDAALSLIWVSPDMHKVHHSDLPSETDSNYGNLFSLFDRAFGTFTPSARARNVVYGLRDVTPTEARSLSALLALPFRRGQRAGGELSGESASSSP